MYTNMKRLRFLFFLTALLLPLSLCARAQEPQEQDVQEERELLAKAIYACTGQVSFCREWRLCIGELLLNRVASPEFPDTLEEVIYADETYCGKVEGYFAAITPDSRAYAAADRLLAGERVLNDPSVVWQNCHIYDGGVCKSYYDYRWGTIYFCRSPQQELYW